MAGERLVVKEGKAVGTALPLTGELVIGRDQGEQASLGGDTELSRRHADITRAATGELLVRDLGSTNGTFVNGQRISAPTRLSPGDRIQLGSTTLELEGDEQVTAAHATPGAQVTSVRSSPPIDTGRPTTAGAPAPRPPVPAAGAAAGGAAAGAAAAHSGGPSPVTSPDAPKAQPPGPSPFARKPTGATPPPTKKGGPPVGVLAIIGLVLGLAVGGGIGALVWAGGDDDGRTEQFFAFAQGFSQDRLNEQTGQLEINIRATTFNSPYNIRSLRVNKFLDNTTPPPQRVYDATYTFTTLGRDTLVLEAAGEATEPQGPDEFFAQTHESWRVVDGTGVFEGVEGEGQLDTALIINRGDGANLVKYFTGDLVFPD